MSKCIDCEKRFPACQDHCEYGIEQKRLRDEQKQALYEAKKALWSVDCYKIDMFRRTRKRKE